MAEKIKHKDEIGHLRTEGVAAKWAELSQDGSSAHSLSSGGMITYREEFKLELLSSKEAMKILKDDRLLKRAMAFASSHNQDLSREYASAISEIALKFGQSTAVEKLLGVLDMYENVGDKFFFQVIFDVCKTPGIEKMSAEKFLARCDSVLSQSNFEIISTNLQKRGESSARDFLLVALDYPDPSGRTLSETDKTVSCYARAQQATIHKELAWTPLFESELSSEEFLGLCALLRSKSVLATIKKYRGDAGNTVIHNVVCDFREHKDPMRVSKICEIMQDAKVYKAACQERLVRSYRKEEKENQMWLCEAARRLQSLYAVHIVVDTLSKYAPESASTVGYMILRQLLDYKKVLHEHSLAACKFFAREDFVMLAQEGDKERSNPNSVTPMDEMLYLFTKLARQTGCDHEIMAVALERVKEYRKVHGVDASSFLSKEIEDMLEEDPVDRAMLLRKIKGEKIVDLRTKDFYLEELKAGWYDGGSIGIYGTLVGGGHLNIEHAGEKVLSIVNDDHAKVTTTKSGSLTTRIEIESSVGGTKDLIGRKYLVSLSRSPEGIKITKVSMSYSTGYLYNEDVYRLKNKMKMEARSIGAELKLLERE